MADAGTSVGSVALRRARDADAKQVIALLDAAGLETAFDPADVIVAVEGERVVGTARLKALPGGAHELASVAVAPELRGRGVGERLVREALRDATGPVYGLALAPGFFEKQGFRRLAETPAALREKAETLCADVGFVPIEWADAPESVTDEVKRRYGAIARTRAAPLIVIQAAEPAEPEASACCAPAGADEAASACCGGAADDAGGARDYTPEELAALPEGAYLGLGTGNPVRAAEPRLGEVVVDLGSGAGVDVFLAARAVGPTGRAIGVDITPEMVARARENAAKAGLANVEFHEAPIERLPLPDGVADVVVSNCVVNLSEDKPAVLREALRVLKPGGRLVVSDTLRVDGSATPGRPTCDCVAGALSGEEWTRLVSDAGFGGASVTRTDGGVDSCCGGPSQGRVLVHAVKPA